MRFLIIAGEESGEIYGARLMREIKAVMPDAEFHGVGGDRMAAEGLRLIQHCKDMASIGVVQMLEKIVYFLGVLNDVRARVKRRDYDAIILIDYPDFNLRVARAGHGAGVPVFYYVCPQFWAWRRYRIRAVKRWVDTMLVILPFEETFYKERGIDARFIGHPMLDEIDFTKDRAALKREFLPPGCSTLVGMLPGSRNSEVGYNLPTLLETAGIIRRERPDAGFVLPVAHHMSDAKIREAAGDRPYVKIVKGRSHDVMAACDLLITKSGTSTLEAAIFGAPMIIVYRSSSINYWLAKLLVHVEYAGLPNLIAGREVAKEYFQSRFVPATVAAEAAALLSSPERLREKRAEMDAIRRQLGDAGAAKRAAAIIASRLNKS
ncbi:MAG: lipid-A-disaccharide synthase [Nitrospinae bacterium]|nr:lipid-A-disaccharide synthase [Nitrospinota bacterium]